MLNSTYAQDIFSRHCLIHHATRKAISRSSKHLCKNAYRSILPVLAHLWAVRLATDVCLIAADAARCTFIKPFLRRLIMKAASRLIRIVTCSAVLSASLLLSSCSECPGPPVKSPQDAFDVLKRTLLNGKFYNGTSYFERFQSRGGKREMLEDVDYDNGRNCQKPPRYYQYSTTSDPNVGTIWFQAVVPGSCPTCWRRIFVSSFVDKQCATLIDTDMNTDEISGHCDQPISRPPEK